MSFFPEVNIGERMRAAAASSSALSKRARESAAESVQSTTTASTNIAKQIDAQPYNWPHDASLSPATTALVLIDMQRDFCEEGGYLDVQGYSLDDTRAIIKPLVRLLEAFRNAGFPVYHTREGHRPDLSTLSSRERFRSRRNPSGLGIGDEGGLGRMLVRGESGQTTISELYPVAGEPIIEKPGRSAFAHTDFELLLRIKGIKNLVLGGVTTDVCVTSTMREASDRAFDCLIVEDGCAASDEALHEAALEMVRTEGGIFGSTASVDDVLTTIKTFGKLESVDIGGSMMQSVSIST